MLKYFRRFTNVLDYGPVILTVIAATFATFASTRANIENKEILQWVLIVLTLLATTQLLEKFRVFRSIDDKLAIIIDSSMGIGSAKEFFVERIPHLEERLNKAKSIYINGMSLSTTSDNFGGHLSNALRREET